MNTKYALQLHSIESFTHSIIIGFLHLNANTDWVCVHVQLLGQIIKEVLKGPGMPDNDQLTTNDQVNRCHFGIKKKRSTAMRSKFSL